MWVGRLGFDSDSDTEGWHFAAAKVLLPCWQLLSYVLRTTQEIARNYSREMMLVLLKPHNIANGCILCA